jgi:hypothetical protein
MVTLSFYLYLYGDPRNTALGSMDSTTLPDAG